MGNMYSWSNVYYENLKRKWRSSLLLQMEKVICKQKNRKRQKVKL